MTCSLHFLELVTASAIAISMTIAVLFAIYMLKR